MHKSSLFLPLVFLLFLTTACNDSSLNQPTNRSGTTSILQMGNYSSIENPHNAYNIYGTLHNDALDYIIAHRSCAIDQMTQDEIATLTAEYVDLISDDLSASDRPALKAVGLNTMSILDALSAHPVSEAYDGLNLSPAQRDFCDQVFAVIRSESVQDLASMMAGFNTVENAILNSPMPADEKSVPLTIVAIAKHSAAYHAPYYLDGNVLGKRGGGIMATKMQKFRDAVESDAVGAAFGALGGFISGAIAGGIGGLLTGGPAGGLAGASGGALVGAAAGGVAGGVTSSMHELTRMDKPPR